VSKSTVWTSVSDGVEWNVSLFKTQGKN
jgi:hypothetical protein